MVPANIYLGGYRKVNSIVTEEELSYSSCEIGDINPSTVLDYDIVVVGAGAAGVPAAGWAAELGAKVALLQKEVGVVSQGNCGSAIIRSRSTEAGIEKWIHHTNSLCNWRANTKQLRAYAKYSEEAMMWLFNRAGFTTETEYGDGSKVDDNANSATLLNDGDKLSAFRSTSADFTGVWKDRTNTYDYGYKQQFRSHYARLDLMWNISNAIGGYRSDRFLDIAPYLGAGMMWAVTPGKDPILGKHVRDREIGVTVGLYNMFRVCDALDITLDINQTVVNQAWDRDTKGRRREFTGNVALGLAYNFHNRSFHRSHAPVDVTPFTSKIKDLNDALAKINAKNDQLQKDLDAEKAKKGNGQTVYVPGETKVVPSPFAVYFPLGKSTLAADQKASIKYFVENAMAANKDRVFEIVGAADSATGSAKTNERLGQARLDAVLGIIKACGGNYKISEKNLGGTDEFSKTDNKLNRVVVIK